MILIYIGILRCKVSCKINALMFNILKATLKKKCLMISYITLSLQIKLLMPKAFYWESLEEKAAGVDYKAMTYLDFIARGNVRSRKNQILDSLIIQTVFQFVEFRRHLFQDFLHLHVFAFGYVIIDFIPMFQNWWLK